MKKKYLKKLSGIYHKALQAIGPRHWWPGDSPFEIALGAILTQNTAWKNVEKAITQLKENNLLSPEGIQKVATKNLAEIIRSSGYYNMKAKKLKAFVHFLFERYQGKMTRMKKTPLAILREELLNVHGIGPETADSILLYAQQKPSFVVDAYTRRIFSRHGLFAENVQYDTMRAFFMKHLPHDEKLFNEFHALIVFIGHHYCRKTPLCEQCPWNWIEF